MTAKEWSLKMRLPFCGGVVFAMHCDEYEILQTAYLLSPAESQLPPQNMLAAEAARQLRAYCKKPRGFVFDLKMKRANTGYQRRVREAMLKVKGGETRTYGDIAKQIRSGPRAVGGACRVNEMSLFVPCHRIVAADGIGGFMNERRGDGANIKRALLRHEHVL